MNIDQLKAVRAIHLNGTFSKAAQELFISQPALSMQIRSLEEEIGETLFKKAGRNKIFTTTGKLILDHASTIIAEFDSLNNNLKLMKKFESGEISIAASDTVTRYLLVDILSMFTKKYPKIGIRIWNKTTSEILSMLQAGKTDIGIVTLPVSIKGFECAELLSYKYVAISSPTETPNLNKPVTLRELAKQNLLLLERGTVTRNTIESVFTAKKNQIAQVVDLGSVDVQKDLAKIGVGTAIVPDFSVVNEQKKKELMVRPIVGMPISKLGIVSRMSQATSTKVFISELEERIKKRQVD